MSARSFGSQCIVSPHLGSDERGRPFLRFGGKQIRQAAARIVYRLFVGEVQHWQAVSHRCRNDACLNPRHLYLRAVLEANADKGNRARLTAEDYWYIRRTPLSSRQLAAKFDYERGNICQILRRKVGRTERFSLRYALLILWERITMKGRRRV